METAASYIAEFLKAHHYRQIMIMVKSRTITKEIWAWSQKEFLCGDLVLVEGSLKAIITDLLHPISKIYTHTRLHSGHVSVINKTEFVSEVSRLQPVALEGFKEQYVIYASCLGLTQIYMRHKTTWN